MTHYLKCNNCGHLNEVKSEYLIFCSKCDKKLENNFTAWKKKNPNKTFDEFKQLVCLTQEAIQNSPVTPKPKSGKFKYWIAFAVTFAIFYVIGQFGGESIARYFKSEKTSREILAREWTKDTYGSFGLTGETPEKMTRGDLPIPENIKQIIDQMDVYNYLSNKGFKVIINSLKYNPSIGEVNLQGAADGSVNEMKKQKGVTDFDYSEEPLNKKDIPGFIQKGTYKQDGLGVEYINTGFSKGLILWQVMVAYQADDEIGRTAAKRVIDSIEINENTSTP
jgi:hypothetical protein